MSAAVLALAPQAAPPADPSPPPECVVHDCSGGYRAHVKAHALRRFADRVMGLEPVLEGLDDRQALQAVRGLGYDLDGVRRWIAFYGYPGPRSYRVGSLLGDRAGSARGKADASHQADLNALAQTLAAEKADWASADTAAARAAETAAAAEAARTTAEESLDATRSRPGRHGSTRRARPAAAGPTSSGQRAVAARIANTAR